MSRGIRVLVVDDSAYNRRTIIKMLEAVPNVEVVGYACNGEEGLRKVFDLKPDLVTLDLEMPRMDGFSFLRILMASRPTPVIVVSARNDDDNVFRALEHGALEFVAKPSGRVSPELLNIREDLISKVQVIAGSDPRKLLSRPALGKSSLKPKAAPPPPNRILPQGEGIRAVVIGSSTGGPPALQTILSAIREPLPVAMAISQHMPPGFTNAFASRLDKYSGMEIKEAKTGDLMLPGRVLVAPGGFNLVFRKLSDNIVVHNVNPASEQRYVPSVDAMFSSASEVFGKHLLGLVLTGMGNDGSRGVLDIHRHGGQVLAEAESTSIVFGMPREAIATGKVDKVVALPDICREILRRCRI